MGKDVRRLKSYKRLYNIGFSASGKLNALAGEEPNKTKRDKLLDKASEINDYMFALRRAQLVELTTPGPGEAKGAGARLRDAIKVAEDDLDKLEKLASALKTASDLLSRAKKLFRLVA
jgi:hypothetical protein